MKLCKKCGDSIPPTASVGGRIRVLTSRKYCLACSPFGSNNRRVLHRAHETRFCNVCDREVSEGSRCYTCTSRIRRFRLKSAAIKFLGGRCLRCGWSGHIAGFDFHHPGDKDFQIGDATNRSWGVVKQELKRCELLCSCCHGIEHSGEHGERFMSAVNSYRGNLLEW